MGLMCRMVGHRRSNGLLWRRGGHWHGLCQRCGSELVRTGQGHWLADGGAVNPVPVPVQPRQVPALGHPA